MESFSPLGPRCHTCLRDVAMEFMAMVLIQLKYTCDDPPVRHSLFLFLFSCCPSEMLQGADNPVYRFTYTIQPSSPSPYHHLIFNSIPIIHFAYCHQKNWLHPQHFSVSRHYCCIVSHWQFQDRYCESLSLVFWSLSLDPPVYTCIYAGLIWKLVIITALSIFSCFRTTFLNSFFSMQNHQPSLWHEYIQQSIILLYHNINGHINSSI